MWEDVATLGLSGLTSALAVHETRQNRRFQRDQSGTAHQREVKDLRAAGLNPLLSARHGGASTPPGSAANIADLGASLSQSRQASSARAAVAQQAPLISAQIRDVNSAAALKDAEAARVRAMTPGQVKQIDAQMEDLVSQQGLRQKTADHLQALISKIQEEKKLLAAQTLSETVRMNKEKALKALWQNVGRVLDSLDKNLRPKVEQVLKDLTEGKSPFHPEQTKKNWNMDFPFSFDIEKWKNRKRR